MIVRNILAMPSGDAWVTFDDYDVPVLVRKGYQLDRQENDAGVLWVMLGEGKAYQLSFTPKPKPFAFDFIP